MKMYSSHGWKGVRRSGAGCLVLVLLFFAVRADEPSELFEKGKALYTAHSGSEELAQAASLFKEAAESGHAGAQGFYGFLLSRGDGVPRDDGAAAIWMGKAADAGIASAQLNLGLMILQGRVTEATPSSGEAWITKAAESGNQDAQVRLAEIYYFGESGVARNWNKSLQWARKAAEQGNAWAQNLVGTLLESGTTGKVDRREAMIWYRQAAEQGNAKAQASLGRLYESGLVGDRDVVEAYYWLWQGVEQGEPNAINYLKDLVPGMTPAEREAALRRIGEENDP